MPETSGDTAAIILSGGGAYAAYEIGVMRALFSGAAPSTGYKPLDAKIIAGTSSGAFSAAAFTSLCGSDPQTAAERVADIWLDEIADQGQGCGNGVYRYRANPFEGFGVSCPAPTPGTPLSRFVQDSVLLTEDFIRRGTHFFASQSSLDQRLLELLDLSSIISTEPFARTAQRTIQLEPIRNSPIKLLIAATNWKTGDLRLFQNQDMRDEVGYEIIRASAAVPGIFHSVEVEGEPYVDGGVVLNTPLKPAIDLGASSLHIVYINPEVARIPLPRVRNTMNELFRALVINLALNVNSDIDQARQVNLGMQLLAHPERIKTTPQVKTLINQISGIARHIQQDTPAYRTLTIHRYHPQEMYGGLFRWLSFGRDHLLALMQRGFADALTHDCLASGCVLPDDLPSLDEADRRAIRS